MTTTDSPSYVLVDVWLMEASGHTTLAGGVGAGPRANGIVNVQTKDQPFRATVCVPLGTPLSSKDVGDCNHITNWTGGACAGAVPIRLGSAKYKFWYGVSHIDNLEYFTVTPRDRRPNHPRDGLSTPRWNELFVIKCACCGIPSHCVWQCTQTVPCSDMTCPTCGHGHASAAPPTATAPPAASTIRPRDNLLEYYRRIAPGVDPRTIPAGSTTEYTYQYNDQADEAPKHGHLYGKERGVAESKRDTDAAAAGAGGARVEVDVDYFQRPRRRLRVQEFSELGRNMRRSMWHESRMLGATHRPFVRGRRRLPPRPSTLDGDMELALRLSMQDAQGGGGGPGEATLPSSVLSPVSQAYDDGEEEVVVDDAYLGDEPELECPLTPVEEERDTPPALRVDAVARTAEELNFGRLNFEVLSDEEDGAVVDGDGYHTPPGQTRIEQFFGYK